jgi:hypothetical protein
LAVDDHILRPIGVDRQFVIAVRDRDVAVARSRLKTVLAHQALDLLVFDDRPLLSKGRLHALPAIAPEQVTDGGDRFNDGGIVDDRS